MKNTRVFLVVFLLLFSSSCAVRNTMDGEYLEPEKGLVGFIIHSNWKGNTSKFFAPIDFLFKKDGRQARKVTMKSGKDLFIIKLESGHYEPVAIAIGNTSFSLEGFGGFDVEPGKMIYIGDIYIALKNEGLFGLMSGAQIAVIDNTPGFHEEAKENYPETYEKYSPESRVLVQEKW